MTRSQAKVLIELIESMQHNEAVEMVQSLIDPREDELRFCIVRDAYVCEARIVTPNPREVEARIQQECAAWVRQETAHAFTVYRATIHGEYTPELVMRRK